MTTTSSAIHTKIRKENKVSQQTGWKAVVDRHASKGLPEWQCCFNSFIWPCLL